MASHGRRGLSALVLASEIHKVLVHSTIPVLVCRVRFRTKFVTTSRLARYARQPSFLYG